MIQKCSSLFFNLRKQLHAVFPCYLKFAPKGGFLCSPEHGKLCFEAPETEVVPQNNLPLAGGRKRSPKSRFYVH